MSTVTKTKRPKPSPPKPPEAYFLRRFTVAEYHRMIDAEILTADDRLELLDGWIVEKMTQYPPHAYVVQKLVKYLIKALPEDWECRSQLPVTLETSEPEPDVAIVRGPHQRYKERHPGPEDIGLLIEVSYSSLAKDRIEKARIYAAAAIAEYWILDVAAGAIEVFTKPANGKQARYRKQKEYGPDDSIPVILQEKLITEIPLRNILE